MQFWPLTGLLLATMSTATYAAEPNPMTAGDVSCTSYLGAADGSAEKRELDSWAAGRVAAIVSASFQPTLRSTSMDQFRKDLGGVCEEIGSSAGLFEASAILAYRYEQSRE